MVSTVSGEEPMKSSEKAHDDLTAIKGIGSIRQDWFRDSFNVRTFQDLATLSVDKIASRLKADGQIPSQSAIESWIFQAREFAAATGPSARQAGELANAKTKEDDHLLTKEGEWEFVSVFLVEFRVLKANDREIRRAITVERREINKKGMWLQDNGVKEPVEVEGQDLYTWMVEQLGEDVWPEPKAHDLVQPKPAKPLPPAKPPAKVKITEVRVFQPPQSETPAQIIKRAEPFQASVKSDEPFAVDVDFELVGPAAADVVRKEIKCTAQSYVYDRAKDTSVHLGDAGPSVLQEGKPNFTFALPEATLQQGRYRLWVLLTTQDATLATPDYIEVPLLKVV